LAGLKKTIAAGLASMAALALGASTATAVVLARWTGPDERQVFVGQTDTHTVPSTVWGDVPGTQVTFTVGSGAPRMVHARFGAESLCQGSGWCSVRIVLIEPSGATRELNPASGTDFAFDSNGGNWSAHTAERLYYASVAGTWRLKVQAAKVGNVSNFRLDDYSLVMGLAKP